LCANDQVNELRGAGSTQNVSKLVAVDLYGGGLDPVPVDGCREDPCTAQAPDFLPKQLPFLGS
jgi:hypothetical protein